MQTANPKDSASSYFALKRIFSSTVINKTKMAHCRSHQGSPGVADSRSRWNVGLLYQTTDCPRKLISSHFLANLTELLRSTSSCRFMNLNKNYADNFKSKQMEVLVCYPSTCRGKSWIVLEWRVCIPGFEPWTFLFNIKCQYISSCLPEIFRSSITGRQILHVFVTCYKP